jgi:hypothetical protein
MVATLPATAPHMTGLIHCGIAIMTMTRFLSRKSGPAVGEWHHPDVTTYSCGIAKNIGRKSNQ